MKWTSLPRVRPGWGLAGVRAGSSCSVSRPSSTTACGAAFANVFQASACSLSLRLPRRGPRLAAAASTRRGCAQAKVIGTDVAERWSPNVGWSPNGAQLWGTLFCRVPNSLLSSPSHGFRPRLPCHGLCGRPNLPVAHKAAASPRWWGSRCQGGAQQRAHNTRLSPWEHGSWSWWLFCVR